MATSSPSGASWRKVRSGGAGCVATLMARWLPDPSRAVPAFHEFGQHLSFWEGVYRKAYPDGPPLDDPSGGRNAYTVAQLLTGVLQSPARKNASADRGKSWTDSWYIRYRSTTNPDFGATFPQAITINNRTAIPRTDADMGNAAHIQVIANTAAFHFGTIEQGGSSL